MALAALVLIACSQATLAGHHFEHDAGSVVEVCGICAGLQSEAMPPSTGSAFVPEVLPAACPSPRTVTVAPFEGIAPYPARGPPRVR